jgi:hypothetical protein
MTSPGDGNGAAATKAKKNLTQRRKAAKRRSDFEHESLGKKLTDLCEGFGDLSIKFTLVCPCDLTRPDSYPPNSSFVFSLRLCGFA